MTGELTDFLTARLDDDEAAALAGIETRTRWRAPTSRTALHVVVKVGAWPAARVLAEVEAKRRIVDALDSLSDMGVDSTSDYAQGATAAWREALRLIAFPYADHPDYREEWRP